MAILGTLSFEADGPDKVKVTRISPCTPKEGRSMVFAMSNEDFEKRLGWYRRGEYVQRAFNNLNADEREFLLTGMTSEEWDETFPEEED